MKKHLLSALMCFVLLFAALPLTASAETEITYKYKGRSLSKTYDGKAVVLDLKDVYTNDNLLGEESVSMFHLGLYNKYIVAFWNVNGSSEENTCEYHETSDREYLSLPGEAGSYVVNFKRPDEGNWDSSKIYLTVRYTVSAEVTASPDAEIETGKQIKVPSANEIVNITPSIKENSLNADISGNLEKALNITEAEKQNGVWAWMELKLKSESEAAASDVKLIGDALANNSKVGAYLSINIFKQAVNGNKTSVSELGEPVEITVTVPEELRAKYSDFSIVYTHNGGKAVTVKPESYDKNTGVLKFKADKFSTYALTYTESVSAVLSPKTGNNITAILLLSALISACAIAVLSFDLKRSFSF